MEQTSYIKYLRDMVKDNKVILCATAVVVVNEDNHVLLQKRSDNKKWGLPGGLLEMDESIIDCAIREVKEETNLDIAITRFLGVFNNPQMRWKEKDEARVIAFALVGKVIGGELKINDEESLEYRYFSYEAVPEVHAPDNQEAIRAYFEGKRHLIEGVGFDE
jgi:ADP-ribose pyrophosphatase YjhB (NUDIX family)